MLTQRQRTLTTAAVHNVAPRVLPPHCGPTQSPECWNTGVTQYPQHPSFPVSGKAYSPISDLHLHPRSILKVGAMAEILADKGDKPGAGKGTWRHLQTTRLQPPFFSTGLPHLGQGLVLAASQLQVSLSSWIFCFHLPHLDQRHASFSEQPSADCTVAMDIQFALALHASTCIPRWCRGPAGCWSHCCPGSSASTRPTWPNHPISQQVGC